MNPRRLAPLAFAALAAGCSGGGSSTGPQVFTTYQPASVAIGQPSLTSNDLPATSATRMSAPALGRVAMAGGTLWVPDLYGNRLLGFHGVPTTSGAAADLVLGQVSFDVATAGLSATKMRSPASLAASEGRLFATDSNNHRVLIWSPLPVANGAPATVAIGQQTLDTAVPGCAADRLRFPASVSSGGGRLVVSDSFNHRVLIFFAAPVGSGAGAALVLGQQNMTHCERNDQDGDGIVDGPSPATLYYPGDVWTDGTRIAVADSYNNRVLLWNSFPSTNGQPADVVLGQGDFGINMRNDDAATGLSDGSQPSARTLNAPWGIGSDGTMLAVADTDNSRVLLWSTIPTVSFRPADVVLGQPDFGDDTPRRGSAQTLSGPYSVTFVGQQLLVTDGNSARVLVYDRR